MADDYRRDPEAVFAEAAQAAKAVAIRTVGLFEDEARMLAEENGCTLRVTMRDGQRVIVHADLRPDRINVVMENGRVAAAKVG